MLSKVYVTANEAGQVVVPSKDNSNYGHIRVEQKRTVITDKGWVRSKVLSALMHGTVDELESLGFGVGEIIPGKIVIKESLTPFNAKDPSLDFKVAGKTGVICMVGMQPIYRKCFYNQSGADIDETIAHTNSDVIRQANIKFTETEEFTDVDNDSFSL